MLQDQAHRVAKQLIEQVLEDPQITAQAADFVSQVVNTETARVGLGNLLVQALAMESFQHQALLLSQGVVANILSDEAMIDKTAVFLWQVLQRPDTLKATTELVERVMKDPGTQSHAAELEARALEDMLKEEWVINFTKEFLRREWAAKRHNLSFALLI